MDSAQALCLHCNKGVTSVSCFRATRFWARGDLCSCHRSNFFRNGFGAAVFYGVFSTSLAFLNKAVLSSYDFNFPFFILATQMTLSVLFLELMSSLDVIKIPPFTFAAAKGFLLPSLSYGVHASLSLIALKGMNIPMYTAVKRCTPLVNLFLAVAILRKPWPSHSITISIFTITIGCIIAAYGDLTFDVFTYTVGGLSVFAQGIYLTLVQKASENKMSTFEIMHLNSYNTLPPFIFLSMAVGEPSQIVRSPYIGDPSFVFLLATLVIMGAVLNYSLFLCTSLNSALTTSLIGVAKSSVQTVVGFYVFEGVKFQPWNISGIFLNFLGGVLYTVTKYRESRISSGKLKARENNNTIHNRVQV